MKYGQLTIAPEVIGTYQAAAAAKHTNKHAEGTIKDKDCGDLWLLQWLTWSGRNMYNPVVGSSEYAKPSQILSLQPKATAAARSPVSSRDVRVKYLAGRVQLL
jgi:hypothetical protein